MAILDYNLIDAGATSITGTQMLTDNAKHSLIVTKTDYINDTSVSSGLIFTLSVEAASDTFIESAMGVTPVVRSLDFQLKDDISLGYMQMYTETYRQRVLNGENPSAAEKINMLVTKEEELALYVQYSEAVAFDATSGVVNGRLNGLTTREGFSNNLSNYTLNGRMLSADVVKNVELIEDNPLITTANQQEKDKHTRNTVKITLDKKIVNQLGYNFSYGQNNTPITTTSAVNWSPAKENLFAIAKTGDWAAINNDKANILDSEMKDNFKVNILTNNLPPASVIVYVGNNNPQIWHSSNVKQYDTDTSKRLSLVLGQLGAADNFSPEQFIIKFSSDVYGKINDLNTILNMTYYNRTITYPQSKIKMSAYKWNDYTKPISESTQVADITTGFNAILVELTDWTEVITQPNMYYHNAYKEIQFTIPEKSIYISDIIQIQKLNSVINIPVTLRQDWASPRVVTVAHFDPSIDTQKGEYENTKDVRFDELKNPKPIIIKESTKDFLLKASEPIQISDVVIKEDETLSEKWYQKDEKTATTVKPRAGFTKPLTDENEVRFEFYNEEANITYFGRLKRDTMNSEDTMWRIVPCTTSGTAINGTMEITDVDLSYVEPSKTFVYTRPDALTKYAKWKLAIKKIADDAGNSMDTLEWNIEVERRLVFFPPLPIEEHKLAIDQDSPRVVWAKMVRDVNIKVGDNFLTTSAIFVKFSHVMQDNTINGVGVLSGYQLDKYRFSQKAQMLRGIYFTNNVGKNIMVTENWDGATILLPGNEEYDNNNGVHTLDIPTIKDIYGREIMGMTELDLQPISGIDLTVAGAVNRINSLDEDNDGLDEKVSMWVNPYTNYDELNNEDSTGNSYSRINKNQDNTTLRNVELIGDSNYLTRVRLNWDINAPYAKELLQNTDPKNRVYVITKYDELKDNTPKLQDRLNVYYVFKPYGADTADLNGTTDLLFSDMSHYDMPYTDTKRIQIWLAVTQEQTILTNNNWYTPKDTVFRHILLADLPVNMDTVIKPVIISATTISAIGTTTVTISGKATPNAAISSTYYNGTPIVADANGDYSIVLTGLMSGVRYSFIIQASLSGFTSYASIDGTTN